MSDVVKFTADCQGYNQRLAAKEREFVALIAERDILIEQARSHGVMTGHARKMLAKLNYNIVFPEGFIVSPADQPPADAAKPQGEAQIVRQGEQAAE